MLSRDQLADLAVSGYFGNVAKKDAAAVAANLAPDCRMHVQTEDITYRGKDAIETHFAEFLQVYETISFADFLVTADETTQRVAVRFTITLTKPDGDQTIMRNCNFFTLEGGLIADVVIYMSNGNLEGFAAGAG